MSRVLQSLVVAASIAGLLWFGRWHLLGGLRHKISDPVTAVPWSTDERGQLAAVLFLERIGVEVRPFRRPLTHLREPGALLVVQTASTGRIERREARALLEWVRRGNTLLLFTERNSELLRLLGARVVQGDPASRVWAAASRRLPLLQGAQHPRAGAESWRLEWNHRPDQQPLYTRGEGLTATYLARGAGDVLIFLSPYLVSNEGLVERDNAVLLRNVARDLVAGRTLHVDEYHAGRAQYSSVWRYVLQPGPPLPLLLYAVLLLMLLVWRLRLRFGRPRAATEDLSREGTEFARARADFHWRLRHTRLVAVDLHRRLNLALARGTPSALQAEVDQARADLARLVGVGLGRPRLAALAARIDDLCGRLLACEA